MTGSRPIPRAVASAARTRGRHGAWARTALGAAAIGAAIGCALACAGPNAARFPDPPERSASLELTPYLGRLRTIAVEVAGQPRRFLFDTGGGLTLVSPALSAEAGCLRGAPVSVTRFDGGTLELETCSPLALRAGGLPLAPPATAVFDLARLLPPEAPPLDGLASLQTFADRPVALDLGGGRITLAPGPRNSGDDGDAALVALDARFARGDPPGRLDLHLGIRGRTRTLWFEADSGNLDAVLVSPAAIDELDLSSADAARLSRGELVQASLTISGLAPIPARLRATPMIYDGLLSAEVLERLLLVIDAPRGRAFGRIR